MTTSTDAHLRAARAGAPYGNASLDRILAMFEQPAELPWKVTTCGSCPARIVWTETENATRMPVDAVGNPAGNVVVCEPYALFGDADTPASRALPKDTPPWDTAFRNGELRTVSHFATCPNAAHHRKDRKP